MKILTIEADQRRSGTRISGSSLLEIMVALVLSLIAVAMGAPALTLSLKILTEDRIALDQEVALEAAWNKICARPAQFTLLMQEEVNVGDNRRRNVQLTPLETQNGLRRWRLSVQDPFRTDERWLSK